MVFRLIFLRCRRRCRPVPESSCPVIDRTGIPAQHFQVKLQPLPERYYIQIAGSDKGIVSVRRCFIGPGSAAERRCERHHRRPRTVVIVLCPGTHERRIIGKTKCDGIQNQMRLFGGRVSPKRKATKISHTHTKKHRSNGF